MPGRVLLLKAANANPFSSGDLSPWLERARSLPARVILTRGSLREGGPWAGVHEIFDGLLPHLREKAPALVERHDYELATILPRLRGSLSVRNPNLTDSAPDRERVRLYPAERALRIVHGLIDLLSAWKESHEPDLWVIACLDLDQAGPLAQRFFTELMRRRGARAGVSLLATSRATQAEDLASRFQSGVVRPVRVQGRLVEAADPAAMAARARALEQAAGEDPIEREVQAPGVIHAWLCSGEPERALPWQVEAFAIYTKQGFYEEALEYGEAVRRVLESYCAGDERKRVRLINKLCSCYVASGAPEKALEIVEEGIARLEEPGLRGYIHYLLAMLHARFLPARDLGRAEENLDLGLAGIDASSLDDDEKHFQRAFNRNGLALVRHFQGRPAEAIALCQGSFRILEAHLDPQRHKLHRSVLLYNMAQVYGAIDDFEKAIAHYSSAMEMDPNYSEYYNERGSLYLKHGFLDEACRDFQQAIELSPPYFEVWTNLGQCLRRLGRDGEAVQALSTALDLEPLSGLARLARAQSFDALGESQRAIEDYTEAIARDPAQWEALANRAALFFQIGRLDESLRDLDASLGLQPEVGELYQNRAAILELLGCQERAAADLRKYLDFRPQAEDRPDVEACLERLAKSLQGSALTQSA
jgi:tetratricopeptide (TPR) repeat protein